MQMPCNGKKGKFVTTHWDHKHHYGTTSGSGNTGGTSVPSAHLSATCTSNSYEPLAKPDEDPEEADDELVYTGASAWCAVTTDAPATDLEIVLHSHPSTNFERENVGMDISGVASKVGKICCQDVNVNGMVAFLLVLFWVVNGI